MKKALMAVKNGVMRIHYNSPVVLTYALVSFAAVALNALICNNWLLYNLFSVYKSSLTDPLAYIRVFGHALGHVSFEHYFGNILLILMIGPILEEKYGSRNLGIMMALTALVTGILHMIFFSTRLAGASGVVFMLILLSSYANLKKGRIPLTLIVTVALFLGREVASGILTSDGISNSTHVIGGLCGAGFGFFLNKRPKAKSEKPLADISEADAGKRDEIIDLTERK